MKEICLLGASPWQMHTQANDAQENAVIDLTALNNQTITLLGISADQLHDSNIIV